MNFTHHFRHSGSVALQGLLFMPIAGVAAALALAVIYGFAVFYIPFIYLNFLLTAGFGLLVGWASGAAGRIGKVRNPMVAAVFGALAGVVAEYAGWVVWIFAASERQTLIVTPSTLWLALNQLALQGSWSMFHWTPTGFFLWMFWTIEAVIIVGGAALAAHGTIEERAFCERCETWLPKPTEVSPLVPLPDRAAWKAKVEHSPRLLEELSKSSGAPTTYTKLEVSECPTCRQLAVVSVKCVDVVREGKEEKVKEETLVEKLLVDASTVHALRALARKSG